MKYLNKYKTYQYKTISNWKYKILVKIWMFPTKFGINKITSRTYFFLKKILIDPFNKEFHIDDKYIITDGEFRGKRFGEAINQCNSLCMLYVNDIIDFEIIK